MTEDPIALKAYEELAEAFAARVETKAHNAFYERPAMPLARVRALSRILDVRFLNPIRLTSIRLGGEKKDARRVMDERRTS